MADYWVSQARHWCKYCKKYIANNKPSITLHENGNAHKDQVERFLRGVYQKGRQDQKDAESVRRELQRIEKAALQSFGPNDRNHTFTQDELKPIRKAVDYVVPNIPTLEELQQQHQAEQQEPLQGREEWAVKTSISQVGEWQTVEKPIPKPVKPKVEEKKESSSHDQKPEFQDDEDKEEKDKLRGFKLKEKEYPDDALFDEKGEDKGDEKVVFKKRSLDSSNALKSRKKTFRKKGN